MRLTKIIAALALVAGTFAIPQPSSATNTSSFTVNRSPIITSGYSPQEREQIEAHLDAVKLIRTAIGSVAQDQYDRTLAKYFDMKDHQLVWSK